MAGFCLLLYMETTGYMVDTKECPVHQAQIGTCLEYADLGYHFSHSSVCMNCRCTEKKDSGN